MRNATNQPALKPASANPEAMPYFPPHRILALFLVSLMAAPFASARAGEDSVQHWLDRMSRAVETLDYRGTLVHVRNGEVDTLRIIHRSDDNGVRERIYSVDGVPREVLRNGDSVRCILPGDEPTMLESQLAGRLLPSLPVSRLLGPESGYLMSLGGNERVADMKARIVHIQPRDAYRYGSRLWLEERTGMLLRYALIDHDGRQLQQLSFTSLELGVNISDAELEPELVGRQVTTESMDEALQSAGARNVGPVSVRPRVPRGFRLVNAGRSSSICSTATACRVFRSTSSIQAARPWPAGSRRWVLFMFIRLRPPDVSLRLSARCPPPRSSSSAASFGAQAACPLVAESAA